MQPPLSQTKSFDIETDTHALHKRKASPWHPDRKVVCAAVDLLGDAAKPPAKLWWFGKAGAPKGWLKPVLEGTKVLVGASIKFDILHAIVGDDENLEAWMDWVCRGGWVWDIQLAEFKLNGMTQADHMLALDDMAPRYGGDLKHDEVKALWAAGVQTSDIEPSLLSRYLAGGPDESGQWKPGDVQNTLMVYRGQVKRARECGQLNDILLNMGSLLCSIEMERNGMFVDKALGVTIAGELEVALAALHESLNTFLPVLPFKFNWGSTRQRSALLFGGQVKYEATEYLGEVPSDVEGLSDEVWWCPERDGDQPSGWAQRYARKSDTHYVLQDGTTAEVLWWEHCANTEWQGEPPEGKCRVMIEKGAKAGTWRTKKVDAPDITKPKKRKCEVYYTFPRMTAPKPEWESEAEPGVYSTASEVIEELGVRNLPFLKALAQMQAMSKDLGTYFITTDDKGVEKGMLTLVGGDGVIHHSINHTSTVTGRFSSSNPNLQNIPKGNKSKIKTVFVSRWGAEGTIIQSDFSSLEVYVQAILTRCARLIADLQAGIDMHCMRLSVAEGKPYDEVLLLCKGDSKRGIEADPVWDYKRTGAKVFSFQRAYGAGAAKIAASTGMEVEDVEALIAAEDLRYPEIPEYYLGLTKDVLGARRPTHKYLPHPLTKQMVNLGVASHRTPDGALYVYEEQLSPDFLARKGKLASFSPTQIRNYGTQGTGGQWMKAAMWLLVREFYRRRNFGGLALLVNTVHDAAYADSHITVREDAAALIHACMEAASGYMEYLFGWDIPVPVPSDTTWGPSMADEQKLPWVKEAAASLRLEIRNLYMKGYTPSFEKGTQ